MEFTKTIDFTRIKCYPIGVPMCKNPDKCDLYDYLRRSYDPIRDSAYMPFQLERIENKRIDYSMMTVDDFLVRVFGKHVCTAKEMRESTMDNDEYVRIRDSFDLEKTSFIYELSKHKWFKCLFSMVPDCSKYINIVSWQKAREYGVLKRYFGERNFLNIPLGDDKVFNVMCSYNSDYHDLLVMY